MIKIGFLGCGNMGGSIANAINNDYEVYVFDKDQAKAKAISNVTVFSSESELLEKSDIIILAVKPQILPSLYPLLSEFSTKKYISIAAGVPLEVLERKINCKNIVRFMPNIAAKSKAAVTAIAASRSADKEFIQTAFDIATHFGSAFMLDENLFPAFIGISGSAIAYVF